MKQLLASRGQRRAGAPPPPGVSGPSGRADVIKNKTQVHHFLLLLVSIVFFSLAFILEQHRGRSHPLALWKQLQGNNILVDGSVEVLKTLDENLVGDRRL